MPPAIGGPARRWGWLAAALAPPGAGAAGAGAGSTGTAATACVTGTATGSATGGGAGGIFGASRWVTGLVDTVSIDDFGTGVGLLDRKGSRAMCVVTGVVTGRMPSLAS